MSTASNFASFLQEIGHTVVPVKNFYAYDKQKFAWLAFPFDQSMHHDAEVDSIMRSHKRMVLLRYCELEEGKGIDSHRMVCRNKSYDLPALSSNSRSHIRRGLKRCVIEQVSPKDLKQSGFELFQSTRVRQSRPLDSRARKTWELYCDSASGTEGFSAWAAWHEGNLASLMIGFQIDGCFNILRQASSSDYLKAYPNNALVFTATRELMARSDISEVSYGLSPLSEQVLSLDKFKMQMGYKSVPTRQNVLITPGARRWAPTAYRMLSTLQLIRPDSNAINQANAMLMVANAKR